MTRRRRVPRSSPTRAGAIFALAALSLVATGCAAPPRADTPVVASRTGADVVVTARDDGRTVELVRGQMLEAWMTSHPAQGFTIRLATLVAPVLQQQGRPEHVDDSEKALLDGVGSFERWRFRAGEAGRVRLRFDYRRPWDGTGPPTRTVVFDVVVR